MESWKNIVGLEDYYEVSDLGNIRSKVREGVTLYGKRTYGGNVIKPFISTVGYPAVNLTFKGYRKQFYLHRLVLEAFVGKAPEGMEACHNNGIRADAKLTNLRWDTRSNNALDKRNHETWQGGENNGNAKLTNQQAQEIKNSNSSSKKLAKLYGVGQTTILRVKHSKTYDARKFNT
jgi:hypothetical protein